MTRIKQVIKYRMPLSIKEDDTFFQGLLNVQSKISHLWKLNTDAFAIEEVEESDLNNRIETPHLT